MRLELTDIDAYYGQSHILHGVQERGAARRRRPRRTGDVVTAVPRP